MTTQPSVGCYTVDEVNKIVYEATREMQNEIERLRVALAMARTVCTHQHIYQHIGQATAAGQLMRCECCGHIKVEPWK